MKIAYSAVLVVVIVVYWRKYGPQNFLWFSDVALIGAAPALWLESGFLASMMAVGVLLPEAVWNFDFFTRVMTGRRVVGLSGYMFERDRPLYLRALSAFHVVLPILLLWLVARLGYDGRAWIAQTALAWLVLSLSRAFTDPERNINWVFGLGEEMQDRLPPLVYLAILMIAFPLFVFYPTHLLLSSLFADG